MDFNKLKLDKFNNIKLVNFEKYEMPVESTDENPEVIIYYIDKPEDVEKFVKFTQELNLPKENRVIMVYEKGRKDGVNRDLLIKPFKKEDCYGVDTTKGYQLKAPMMCSLSEKLSALTMMKL